MRTTVEIDPKLLAEAMEVTGVKTKREVIHLALREAIRGKRIEQLIDAAGKYDIDLTPEMLEEMRQDELEPVRVDE